MHVKACCIDNVPVVVALPRTGETHVCFGCNELYFRLIVGAPKENNRKLLSRSDVTEHGSLYKCSLGGKNQSSVCEKLEPEIVHINGNYIQFK